MLHAIMYCAATCTLKLQDSEVSMSHSQRSNPENPRWLSKCTHDCRLSMDEPNLQCVPKPRDFLVPMTQLPTTASKDAHRIYTCNVRYETRAIA